MKKGLFFIATIILLPSISYASRLDYQGRPTSYASGLDYQGKPTSIVNGRLLDENQIRITGEVQPCKWNTFKKEAEITADVTFEYIADRKLGIDKCFSAQTYEDGLLNGVLQVYELQDIKVTRDRAYDQYQNPITGVVLSYNSFGNLALQEEYKDGYLDGITIAYVDTGFQLETPYKKGLKDGVERLYRPPPGRLVAGEYPYRNGLREGVSKEYFKSGQIALEASYKAGKRDGVLKEYSSQGVLIRESWSTNGLRNGEKKKIL